MTVVYHGTPLSPISELMKMGGKNFCVSFARPDDAARCMQIGQSIMWDNGAFSAYTLGKPINKYKLYDWLEERLGHPHWAVIPDVIGGSVEDNRKELLDWPYPSELSAPVWHLNTPIDYLLELADDYHRICFGSSGDYWQVGSDRWSNRIDEAFNALVNHHKYLPHIHMLRGTSQVGKRWPFASVDSTNVCRNFKDKGKCPELMARKIDSVQGTIKWVEQPTQRTFLRLVND